MSDGDRQATRTLYALIALCVANHMVLVGARVAVTLSALAQGAGPGAVGMLLALFAILPMLVAVSAGRWSDRAGVRNPMLVGSVLLAFGTTLPCALPGLWPLYVAAPLVGVAFSVFQIAAQNATGELGGAVNRARNFGLLALGQSTSGIIGPLVAGLSIDHLGFDWAFGVLALVPLLPAMVLAGGWLPALPGPHPLHAHVARGGVLALLADPRLQRLFAVNALFSLGWELHAIFIPIFGDSIGLSASAIGAVIAAFAAATFAVRFAMPLISRHANENQVLSTALLVAGVAYCMLPFARNAIALMCVSFGIGLGLGGGQPMVMSLLHSRAPPGRLGEAGGVRMSLGQSMAVAVPLVFGAFGATFGLAPVLWSVGICLTTGGLYAKRKL
ncbi:MAG: MFS transporter [Betaproteobacteria bacterium]